jgi:hypothetical protein
MLAHFNFYWLGKTMQTEVLRRNEANNELLESLFTWNACKGTAKFNNLRKGI